MADTETRRHKLFARPPAEIASFAITQPQRVKVHSAALRKVGERNKNERVSHVDDGWQRLAYQHARLIGEVGYVFQMKANLIARCPLNPQHFVDGHWVNKEDEDDDPGWEKVERVMAAFVGPVGGVAELKRRFALHISIGGETTLLGTPSQNESGLSTGINWEFVSTQELRVTQGSKPTRNADGGQSKELGEEVFLARCWRADPEFSGRSDSAMRRIELVCQELLKLTQMVMAIADSRLPAKILYLSDGLTLPGGDESEPSDDDDQPDSFVEGLYDHLAAPKDDPTSQTTILPFVMRGPPNPGDHIAIYDLGRDQDTWAKDLREEALDRIAAGLEVPKETMKGKSGLSGLGGGNVAQAIDDDLIQRHVIPDGEMMAEFVSFAYTRPMLEDFEDMNQEESSTWRVAFDPGPIQTKMDEGTSARRLHSLSPDIVSNDSVRNANGFDDSDKPTEEEVQERRMWDLLKANPSTLGPVIGPILVPGVDWSQVSTGQTDNPVQNTGLPENEVAAESESTADQGLSLLLERLTVAGDACLDRAFDRAGSIVVTRCQKDPSLRDRTRSVPKAKAPSMLTPAEAIRFTLTPDVLLANAWEPYGLKARGWVRDYLEEQGEDRRYADDIASEASRLICASLHRLASEYLPRGLPSPVGGLRVQRELVEKALANAGVLGLE